MNYRNIYDHCNKHLSEKLQLQPATKFVTEIAKTTKKTLMFTTMPTATQGNSHN